MTDKPAITHTKLRNGAMVGVNEHIYLTPEHLGEPYYIGRVMEFCHVPNRKGLQVRVAWYSRPKDVFNGKRYDSSMLIATMNSDLNPVAAIRGKCIVLHKYHIPKDRFEAYKKQNDCFYYTQMYDRYMQRVYDLLPCDLVQNVPMDVQEALCQRYQFIVVEQGKAADLTGARRTCCVCQTWCNSTSSVKCAGCQKSFHMSCLSPPLTRKPSKGFAWQCAFCSRKESDESDASSPEPATEATATTQPASPGKRPARLRSQQQQQQKIQPKKEKQVHDQKLMPSKPASSLSDNMKIFEDPTQIKTTHMWPFRYLGVNTNIKDILDIDDRIYPRAASRIGSKYQASLSDHLHCQTLSPATASPKKTPGHSPSSTTTTISSTLDDSSLISDDKIPARGTEDSATALFSQPARLKEEELDDYINKVQSLPNLPLAPHSADTFDLALLLLEQTDYNPAAALKKISRVTKDDFGFLATWKADEIETFEQTIKEHGHDLQFMKQNIPTKSMADIVRFFYQWKKSDRYEPVYSVWTKVFRPTKSFKPNTRSIIQCLSVTQQKDVELIEQLTSQAKIVQHHNEVETTAPAKQSFDSSDSDSDATDDYEDKDYKGTKIALPRPSARPIRSIRTTRQSVAQATKKVDAPEAAPAPTTTAATTIHTPSTITTPTIATISQVNESDPSIIPATATSEDGRPFECNNCHVTKSKVWRRVPGDTDRKQKVFARVLCDLCGTHWLKYAKKRPVNNDGASASQTTSTVIARGGNRSRVMKRKIPEVDSDGPSLKRSKESTTVVTMKLHSPCQVCLSMDQPKRLVSCIDCNIMVHDDCFGIGANDIEQWRCDICTNKKKGTVSYFYQCILCGNGPFEKQEAMKPTCGNNWAHITCALFLPRIKFIDAATMSPIEYVGAVYPTEESLRCTICYRSGIGSCIPCSYQNCGTKVHARCALKNGFQAGFKIETPPSSSAHEFVIVEQGTFGRSSSKGVMIPKLYCPHHNLSSYRNLYPMSTRTPENKSWITIYSDLYKRTNPNTTPAIRRYYSWGISNGLELPKYHNHINPSPLSIARSTSSLDAKMGRPPSARKTGTTTRSNGNMLLTTLLNPSCSRCPVTSSPFWWDEEGLVGDGVSDSSTNAKLCQRCYCQLVASRASPEQSASA